MRFIAIAVAAAFWLVPAAPVQAHHAKAADHQEFAQAKKKKKAPKAKPRKKEEYMRAVPSR